MKTIIIPTDFSSAADNAMHYGAQLAQQTGAQVLLLHVYIMPVSMNDMPVLMISAEELKRAADEGLERCQTELEKTYPGLVVKAESRLGDVVNEVADASQEVNPLFVVMGTQGSGQFEQLLFGSTTLSAIKNLKHPVIAVPANYKYQNISAVVLAADLEEVDQTTSALIKNTLQPFNSQLHIVHVKIKEEEEKATPALLQQLQDLQPVYHSIEDDNISHGLQTYIQQVGAGMLVVLPHEHSWLESIFFKMHTKDILKNAQVPVLCIHT